MRRSLTILGILTAIFVFAVFGSTLYFDFFVFDDAELIFANRFVAEPSWGKFFDVWAKSNTPIITNAWQVVSHFCGISSATPFRLLNLVFHSINCVLVFFLCRTIVGRIERDQVGNTSNNYIEKASIVGLICFALHPVHVESVVWVSSFKEVLAGTWGLISFLCYLKGTEKNNVRYEIAAIVFFITGVLTHPTMAALPLVYIWLDLTLFNKSVKDTFYRNGVYLLILISAVVIHKTVNPQIDPSNEQPLFIRISVALNALLSYLEKSFFPFKYSFDYMMTAEGITESTLSEIWPKLKAFLAALGVWSVILCFRRPGLKFIHYSIGMIGLLVSVNLGLIGYAFQNISTIADRFLYFPSIGTSLLFTLLFLKFERAPNRSLKFGGHFLIAIYLSSFLVTTIYRTTLWKSSASLMHASIHNGYESYPLNIALGVSLQKEKKYEYAEKSFLTAYKIAEARNSQKGKVILATSDQAISHLFELYTETKNLSKGMALYQKLLGDSRFIPEQVALSVAEFLMAFELWSEGEILVTYMSTRYQKSEIVQLIKIKMIQTKHDFLLKSYVNMSRYELENQRFRDATLYLQKAVSLRKLYGLTHYELDELIKRIKEQEKLKK